MPGSVVVFTSLQDGGTIRVVRTLRFESALRRRECPSTEILFRRVAVRSSGRPLRSRTKTGRRTRRSSGASAERRQPRKIAQHETGPEPDCVPVGEILINALSLRAEFTAGTIKFAVVPQIMDANFETHSWHMTEKEEKWGYVQEDRAFIDSILDGIPPPVTADDGFKSVELVESVYEAIRSGERVRFS